jgi:hypothetical protein
MRPTSTAAQRYGRGGRGRGGGSSSVLSSNVLQSTPTGPPSEYHATIKDQIGVGQGDAGGNSAAPNAQHLTGKLYEREGYFHNKEYDTRYEELRILREVSPGTSLSQVVADIGAMPAGLRLRTDIRGISIGELAEELRKRYGENFLRGLFIYASVRDVHLSVEGGDGGDEDDGAGEGLMPTRVFNRYIRDTLVKHVPLWKVLSVLPVITNPTTGEKRFFTGGTLDQHMAGMKQLFLERIVALEEGEHFDSELSGSDVASFFLLENVSIVRRTRYPNYMDTRISPIRTGGFGEILPSHNSFTFNVKTFVDRFEEALKQKSPKTTTSKNTSTLTKWRKAQVLHLRTELYALFDPLHCEKRCDFQLVVPGGIGCCVDNCVRLLLNLSLDKPLCYVSPPCLDLVLKAKAAAKEDYVQERMNVNSKKRMRNGDASTLTLQDRFQNDFDSHTKNGYSSYFFRYVRVALLKTCKVNARILYERFENIGPRVGDGLLLRESWGGLQTSQRRRLLELAPEVKTEAVEEGKDNKLGRTNMLMFRIDLRGYIHHHKPKSSSIYGEVEDDIESTGGGVLHAVGVHPYIPFAVLKDKYVLKVLFDLIEEHTIPLMVSSRGKAFGTKHVSAREIESLVLYQKKRHRACATKTLIYGTSEEQEDVLGEEEEIKELDLERRREKKVMRDKMTRRRRRGGNITPGIPGVIVFAQKEFAQKILVVAYDIETVEMTQECVQAGLVPAKFLKFNPDVDKYEQLEKQIPYMVQWVPVNLSDEGCFLEKKVKMKLLPRVDCPNPAFFEKDKWLQDSAGKKKFRKGWIVLDKAKIEYGGNVLGQCVEDFIEHVYQWATQHGYTAVKCYAHNGSGFDTLIVQAFNTRFPVAKLLKVRGSVLNMKVKIPITRTSVPDGVKRGKHFFVNFGDTKKFLTGSLDSLCKDFKLPEEWVKLDFPITRIDWKTCYRPEIKSMVAKYGENDVYALAYIIKQINRMLCLQPREVIFFGQEEYADWGKTLSYVNEHRVSSSSFETLSPTDLFFRKLDAMDIVSVHSARPPIDQFCTIMSFVKRVLHCHVQEQSLQLSSRINAPTPFAVDVPALRHWLDMALIGGRVSAYCKVYASSHLADIMEAVLLDDMERSKFLIEEAVAMQDTMICLDMTSLYPSATRFCPLPMGGIFPLSKEDASVDISCIGCRECDKLMTLCPNHKLSNESPPSAMRRFSIILVKNFRPGPYAKKEGFMNLVGRKFRPSTYKKTGGVPIPSDSFKKSDGLSYSLETPNEATERVWGSRPPSLLSPSSSSSSSFSAFETENEEDDDDSSFCPLQQDPKDWNIYGTTQAFTNIDLYWADRCGFLFEVIGGFGWGISDSLGDLYEGLFGMRVKAKMDDNHSLQLALKLILNGGYGVHCQKLINSIDKVVSMPEDLYDCDIRDPKVVQFLRDKHQNTFDCRYVLKENIPLATKQSFVTAKMPADIGEVCGGSSPNHIGVAILAWSRHLMNLLMFPLMESRPGAVTYTDTDSLTISQESYDTLAKEKPHLMDPFGRTLATYKNEHSDIFPNARILFSALGGKKVKMHLVGCPDTGQVKVCNTFKGYMTEGTDLEGKRYTKDRASFDLSCALIDILFEGKPAPHVGTRWTRSMGEGGGVQIEKNVQFQASTKAYLDHCGGFEILPSPCRACPDALLIGCLPHGSGRLTPRPCDYNDVFIPQKAEETEELVLPFHWAAMLALRMDPRGGAKLTQDYFKTFFAKLFSAKDAFYNGGANWTRINQRIDFVQQNHAEPLSQERGEEEDEDMNYEDFLLPIGEEEEEEEEEEGEEEEGYSPFDFDSCEIFDPFFEEIPSPPRMTTSFEEEMLSE